MGGAHAVAVGDGGKTLHVGVEQHRKRRRFSFAELRKLRRDGLHRAVVLAQLGAGGDGMHGGGISLRGECTGQLTGISDGRRVEPGTDPQRELGSPLLREGRNGLLAPVLRKEPKGADGKLVIGRWTGGMTGLGEGVMASRTAPATLHLRWARAAGADDPVRDHRVEMTPDTGGGETQPAAELRRGGGTKLHQKARDAITGAGVCRVRRAVSRGIRGLIL